MNETVKIALPVNPAGSSGLKVQAAPVPTAVETLEHLEQTLDNLDPVVKPEGDASVEAVETPVAVPEGTLADEPRE